MTWGRLPIFVWAILATTALLTLATPTLVVACLFGILDRTAETAFFVNEHGGSSFLWQNLFWFFGHPEVYIMALPGFGIVMEIMPVFTRKPLFAYRVAAAGMLGVALLSFFVWQHHLFQSGINPDMRPLFMLTTELISIPTGFLFLVTLGTLWKAKIRFDTPMLFCLGMLFNFLIGGVTGVFLSDVPVNVTVHGSFFVLAALPLHDHGWADLRLVRRLLLLVPQDHRQDAEPQARKWHFWTFFVFFNLHVLPDVPHRDPRPAAARVRVRDQPPDAERHLEHQRLPPGCLVPLLHRQLRLVDLPDPAPGSAQPVELARPGVADAHTRAVVQLRAHPGRAERPVPLRRARGSTSGRSGQTHVGRGRRPAPSPTTSSGPASRATATRGPRSCEGT